MMCNNIKKKVPNLSDEIGKLIDAIDGDIISYNWSPSGGYDESRNGKQVKQESWSYYINTSTGLYYLGITWEIANNFAPEETGIRRFGVSVSGSGIALVLITAPDGIRPW